VSDFGGGRGGWVGGLLFDNKHKFHKGTKEKIKARNKARRGDQRRTELQTNVDI
jgi:hypothetical protein